MQQKGFTIIELVIVIVIIGILAVVAIPQFIDLSSNARTAAVQGVAGALGSGSAMNYAARKANPAVGVSVATCTAVANTLAGGLPASYSITGGNITSSATCTVTYTGTSISATFVGFSA